jgi:cellulose synthase/poly-beta-1,6-N-acetylglucosamine synthase-like glycosyltransferase
MAGNRFVRTVEPRYVTFLLYLFLVATAVLIVWRTAVVNWHVWFAPLAWLADVFGLATSALFLITVHRRAEPVPATVAARARTVDVLIPTVSEPLSVLEPAVVGATRVRGVRRVFVLDDGDRPEVARMARLRGARYVARTGRDGAKAGNLNHGLRFTDSELIATFDADHIPLPDFLEHTLGYFDDPDLAVVQTPQAFYNTESFTFRTGWYEQQMFYQCVQPAKNAHNGAFYTGTGAVLRREALDGIGGFATGTATEDIHTSLRLHAAGWQSVFLPRPLAYGLEVDNLREYYRTRRRWAAGSLGLLLRSPDSPLRIRGLSVAQRLSYLSSTLVHFQGAQRLAYLLVPLLALVTTRNPVSVSFAWFGAVFFGFAALSLWLTHRYSHGAYRPWYTEVFNLALAVPQLSGLAGVVRPERKFQVSVKNAGSASGSRIKLIYAVLLAIAVVGLGRAGQLVVTGHGTALVAWSGALLALQAALLIHLLVWVLGYERRAPAPGGRPLVPAARAATGLNIGVHGWVARPYWAPAAQQDPDPARNPLMEA